MTQVTTKAEAVPHVEAVLRWLIEKAQAEVRAKIAAQVERLIVEAGGRCVVPDDCSDDGINICAAHSEILFGDTRTCEDDPRELRAVLALLETVSVTPEASVGERRDPQSFVPGYRIRYIELDNAAAFLVSQGWAGGIGFDEAVKALAATPAASDGSLDVERLALSEAEVDVSEEAEKWGALKSNRAVWLDGAHWVLARWRTALRSSDVQDTTEAKDD